MNPMEKLNIYKISYHNRETKEILYVKSTSEQQVRADWLDLVIDRHYILESCREIKLDEIKAKIPCIQCKLLNDNICKYDTHDIVTQLLPVACDRVEYQEKEQVKKYG